MSTSTLTSPTPSGPEVDAPGASGLDVRPVNQLRVVISEWIKFRSLTSSWITLLATVAGLVGFGALFSYARSVSFDSGTSAPPGGPIAGAFDALATSLGGMTLAQLGVAVLGVMLISAEYSTGMIRSSLAAVPRRLPVLWGKIAVFSGVTFVASLIGVFGAFFVGQALLGDHATTLGADGVLRALVGAALYLTVVGILSLAIGALLRSTAGGIASVLGLLLIVPGLAQLLPSSWQDYILPYLPSNAGSLVYSVTANTGHLGTWSGFAVMCAYAVIAVIGAAWSLRRRDA